jgi:Rrf2 family transcriptional regulator, iron-sulfur cluster assembly transcription factor
MISKTGISATKALAVLARMPENEYVGASAIAREIGAPQNYLGKLLKILAGEGLVVSQKGFGGGFRLARPAAEISLYDIVEPIDKVSRWGGCFLGSGTCSDTSPCSVHGQWKHVREEYLGFLKNTTVADLAGRKDQGG